MNNNIIGGNVYYTSPDTNTGTLTTFELNDGRGVCNIKCYNNNELTIYAYLDAPYIPIMDLKSIECNGDISSYKPIGTIVPKLTGNNANINVTLNF